MNLPEIKVHKILYATDLSENALHAYAYASSLANQYQAAIVLLHVMTEDTRLDEHVIGYIGAGEWEKIKARNLQDAREVLIGKKRGHRAVTEALSRFSENATEAEQPAPEIDEIIVRRGEPVTEILRVAEETGCDLIVMGSHGYGRLEEVLVGSTTRRLLRQTRKPVLVVRLPE